MNTYIPHKKIGGTYACVIAKGDHFGTTPADIWEILTGRKEGDDLTWKLQVQMGIVTEPLNVKFFEKRAKLKVDRSPEACGLHEHDKHEFAVCQPDGLIGKTSIFEAKHTGQFGEWEKILENYYPQMQHNMAVTNTQSCYISTIFSNNRIEYEVVKRDQAYIDNLMEREAAFWNHVLMDTPPPGYVDPLVAKVPPMKTVDMEGNNMWAAKAAIYIDNKAAHDDFEEAKTELKEMAPKDARVTSGHGLKITRAKNGAATVKVID